MFYFVLIGLIYLCVFKQYLGAILIKIICTVYLLVNFPFCVVSD